MKTNSLNKYAILISVIIAGVVFIYWFTYNPTKNFVASVPGMDSVPAKDTGFIEEIRIGEIFTLFESETSNLSGKWTRFRGENSDNINKENIRLINKFEASGPKIKWSVDLGEGHAAPVIFNGKVYLLDYIEEKKMDALRCFSLKTGNELWQRGYKVHVKRNHGMSRTIPAITDKYIVTVGPLGQVMCVNPENGDLLWGLDMEKEYGAEIPFWYTGQCPIIDKDIAVLAPGGKAILIGVDCATGKVVWETPNPDSLQMSHSSVMPMKLGNKNTYVYAAIGAIAGISADAEDIGTVLWQTKAFVPNVVAPSPVILTNGRIFMTAGYGAGSILFEVNPNTFAIEILQVYKPKEGLASEQQTPIVLGNRVYGILPKDAGALRNQFVCYSVNDFKTPIWTSGKTVRFGLGPFIYADEKFFIVDDDGTLTIAKAGSNGFSVLDKFRVVEGHDAWGPIAIADGYLLMRDSKKMVCLDVRR